MIKRLIFDVDSTLIVGVNFLPFIEKTLKRYDLLTQKNIEGIFTMIATYESEYSSYTRENYLTHLNKCLGFEVEETWLDAFFEELKNCVPSKNQRLIDAIDGLSEHYEMVLLTNFFGQSQMNRLNTMGIGKYFSEYFGEELIKPNREIYLKACGAHLPEECVMIGDDVDLDIKGASRCGLKTILVNTKKVPTEGLDCAVIDKVEDIDCDLIESL